MKRLVFILLFALSAVAAQGQGTIQQSGAVTTFHAPAWFDDGVLADAGGPTMPYLDSLGLFDGADCPFGISSQVSPGTPTVPYSAFSICQTDATTTFVFSGYGGMANPTVYFQVGGSTYQFPYTIGGIVGPSSSTVGDIACWNNGGGSLLKDCGALPSNLVGGPSTTVVGNLACWNDTTGALLSDCGVSPKSFRIVSSGATDSELSTDVTIMWKSSTASAKTENLLACNSTNAGIKLTVTDDLGTSSTYPIIVVPNGSDTIANAATPFAVVSPMLPITIQCDGISNWAVING